MKQPDPITIEGGRVWRNRPKRWCAIVDAHYLHVTPLIAVRGEGEGASSSVAAKRAMEDAVQKIYQQLRARES